MPTDDRLPTDHFDAPDLIESARFMTVAAYDVSELDEIVCRRSDGSVVRGVVETRNVDPCLGVVSFTFHRTGTNWPGAVHTVPIDGSVAVRTASLLQTRPDEQL